MIINSSDNQPVKSRDIEQFGFMLNELLVCGREEAARGEIFGQSEKTKEHWGVGEVIERCQNEAENVEMSEIVKLLQVINDELSVAKMSAEKTTSADKPIVAQLSDDKLRGQGRTTAVTGISAIPVYTGGRTKSSSSSPSAQLKTTSVVTPRQKTTSVPPFAHKAPPVRVPVVVPRQMDSTEIRTGRQLTRNTGMHKCTFIAYARSDLTLCYCR
jgi:hypothetical protein